MNNEKVVCIDFGSSYTKIAFRSGWDEQAKLVKNIPIAVLEEDEQLFIPSIVACARGAGGVRWFIGNDADNLEPADNLTIYRDLKKRLFSQEKPDQHEEYRDAAIVFFRDLKQCLGSMNLPFDVERCPVRVCIPRLTQDDSLERLIEDILVRAGWSLAVPARHYTNQNRTSAASSREAAMRHGDRRRNHGSISRII